MWALRIVLLLASALLSFVSSACKDCVSLNLDKDKVVNRYVTWSDVFNATLSPSYAGVSWTSKGRFAYKSDHRGVFKEDVKTRKEVKQYFLSSELFGYDYDISPDDQFAIVYDIKKAKYRHSFYADYFVLNMTDPLGYRRNVSVNPVGEGLGDVQYCGWSSTGHTLMVVADYNLYTTEDPMSKEYKQHTEDGEDNIIFNGVPDWVYEEEVVGNYYSTYHSPGERFIVFTKTNATGVRHVRFPQYGKEDYATIIDYEYPKAGYSVPTVETWVVDLESGEAAAYHLPTPEQVLNWGDHYLYTVSWADNSTVVLEWWNRQQNKTLFYQCTLDGSKTEQCQLLFEPAPTGGWLDWWSKPFWFLRGTEKFATLLPSNQGLEGAFKHIAVIEDSEITFLTSGLYDVLQIYTTFTDDSGTYLFYLATVGGQMYRHVYQLNVDTGTSQCLSCDGYCGYAAASFSADGSMYRLTCYGPVTPYVQVKEVNSMWNAVLEDNAALDAYLRTFTLPQHEYLTERVGGFDINVQRIAPPDFNEEGTRRYPVLVYVYGGPDSGNVKDLFPYGDQRKDFHNFLANGAPHKPQFLVYYIDVRGTLGRGDDFRFPMYKKFGVTEVADTIEFLKILKQKPYVDDARIAIWGWSYGGFLSSKVAGCGERVVQAAISVAPVTTFRLYDNIYTERYMGLPDENENYDLGDVLHEAANFKQTKYFLIHGTADDNVHYTNAAKLAFQLVEENVDFRMHAYTDRAHSLGGRNTRLHLYTMIRNFLYESLALTDPYMDNYTAL